MNSFSMRKLALTSQTVFVYWYIQEVGFLHTRFWEWITMKEAGIARSWSWIRITQEVRITRRSLMVDGVGGKKLLIVKERVFSCTISFTIFFFLSVLIWFDSSCDILSLHTHSNFFFFLCLLEFCFVFTVLWTPNIAKTEIVAGICLFLIFSIFF